MQYKFAFYILKIRQNNVHFKMAIYLSMSICWTLRHSVCLLMDLLSRPDRSRNICSFLMPPLHFVANIYNNMFNHRQVHRKNTITAKDLTTNLRSKNIEKQLKQKEHVSGIISLWGDIVVRHAVCRGWNIYHVLKHGRWWRSRHKSGHKHGLTWFNLFMLTGD